MSNPVPLNLSADLARKYLEIRECGREAKPGVVCSLRPVIGGCQYHMTDEETALAKFVSVYVLDAYRRGMLDEWLRTDEAETADRKVAEYESHVRAVVMNAPQPSEEKLESLAFLFSIGRTDSARKSER